MDFLYNNFNVVPRSIKMLPNMFLKTCSPLKTLVRTHLGYIPFEGRLGPQPNNMQKFIMEHKKANLQPVKKVTYTFDPIKENYHSLRNFMFFWNGKKVRATNLKLMVKTEIVDDRRDPKIVFDLNDGRQLEVQQKYVEKNFILLLNHCRSDLET